MYITLEEYVTLGGQKVTDEDEFERLEYKAWMKVNSRTQGRIKEPLENIKRLMVELIDIELERSTQTVKQIANDGVSITFNSETAYDHREYELIDEYAGKYAWRGVSDIREAT